MLILIAIKSLNQKLILNLIYSDTLYTMCYYVSLMYVLFEYLNNNNNNNNEIFGGVFKYVKWVKLGVLKQGKNEKKNNH